MLNYTVYCPVTQSIRLIDSAGYGRYRYQYYHRPVAKADITQPERVMGSSHWIGKCAPTCSPWRHIRGCTCCGPDARW